MLVDTAGSIFVISDNMSIIELVGKMLAEEFTDVITSTIPEQAAEEFDRSNADVVLLAFDTMDKSEATLNLLVRESQRFNKQLHRTLTMCSKNEVSRAYSLCRERKLDNYIVFWPLSFDPPRLCMTVHQAFNELADYRQAQQRALEMLSQADQIKELGGVLEKQLSEGHSHSAGVEHTVEKAEQDVYEALATIYQQLQQKFKTNNLPEAWSGTVPDANQIRDEFSMVASALQDVRESNRQFARLTHTHKAWLDKFNLCDKSVRSILVVDDDEFQRTVVRGILKKEHYQLEFACSGDEALQILTRSQPDLILMDVMMPGVNGIEITRQLTNDIRFKHIPIVMITAHNERQVVFECMKAGAVDFVVKPYNRDTLIAKVAAAFNSSHHLA